MRNVVLVCLDSVRKDYFDRYAPRLAERADRSFEQCRTASSWSTPSHASMFTGTLPHRHGVHTHDPDFAGLAREDTFLGGVAEHTSIGVSANAYASSTFGFDGLFDTFVDVTPEARFPDGLDPGSFLRSSDRTGPSLYATFLKAAARHDHTIRSVGNGVLARLDSASKRMPIPRLFDDGANVVVRAALREAARAEEPYFLFANVMDAHVPHRPTRGYDRAYFDAPNTWDSTALDDWDVNLGGRSDANDRDLERFRDLYAAAIDYLDRRVSTFVDRLLETSSLETTVVITADHGENLGYVADDGLVGHKASLSEGLLHVPLVVVNPPTSDDAGDGSSDHAADHAADHTNDYAHDGILDDPSDRSSPPSTQEYVSHLDLSRLLVAVAEDRALPDVTAERVPAELIGIGTTLGPLSDPDRAEEYDHWNRMIRCVYDGERKYVWDSLGHSVAYAVDADRASWQGRVAEDVDVPAWARDRFERDIVEYKRDASTSGSGPRSLRESIDEGTLHRLSELGYR